MTPVIRRYLSRELLSHWAGVTLVLWLVMVGARFSLYLGQAASGRLPVDVVLSLLALKSVGFVVFLLPLSLFLALLLVLGRWNRDLESAALAASGFGPGDGARALLPSVLAAALVCAVLTLFVVPKTAQMGYALRAQATEAVETQSLDAGRFVELRGGKLLLYAERRGATQGTLERVFVQLADGAKTALLTAARAVPRVDVPSGRRFVVLEDGYRYDGEPGRADYRILRFDEYGVRLQTDATAEELKWDAVPSGELWSSSDPHAAAELQQRWSRPLSLILLALLALALGRYRPGAGRFGMLFAGILLFIVYFNLLATTHLWIGKGRLAALPGMAWVHLLALLTAVLLFKADDWRLRRWRR